MGPGSSEREPQVAEDVHRHGADLRGAGHREVGRVPQLEEQGVEGRANWWAPAPLRRLYSRYGIGEAEKEPSNRVQV
jgi:hypothetical protein